MTNLVRISLRFLYSMFPNLAMPKVKCREVTLYQFGRFQLNGMVLFMVYVHSIIIFDECGCCLHTTDVTPDLFDIKGNFQILLYSVRLKTHRLYLAA